MGKSEFETALAQLSALSEKIKGQDTDLEEAIRCYEEGMKHYKTCDKILRQAEQKIEFFEGEV